MSTGLHHHQDYWYPSGSGDATSCARGRTDPTIVHPGRVDAEKSGQICGQCHSVNYPLDEASVQQWMADGPVYRAGDDLRDSRHVLRKARMSEAPEFIRRQLQAIPWWFDEVFWPDGMIRVTGREYNGLLDSPCYRGGKFSCLSCHSMHASDPDDQLPRGLIRSHSQLV